MLKCSRCGKHGLLSRINKNTGLCFVCEKHDASLYSGLLKANRKTAFFRNGYLYDLIPRNKSISLYEDRGVAYDKDTVIVSDGAVYDPRNPMSIDNLPIPEYAPINGSLPGVTTDLSYILKMRCSQIEDKALLPLFTQTVLYMMDASPIGWGRDDYFQVIRNFHRHGMFAEGDRFESIFRHNNPSMFSNPFDESQEADNLSTKYYWERKWRHHKEHEELMTLLPDLVPQTYKGYAQIRSRNTKRFQQIVELAIEKGYCFDPNLDSHFCRRFNRPVNMEYGYDFTGRSPRIIYCECPLHDTGVCNGRNEFGLLCVYPSTGKRKVIFCIGQDPDSQISKAFSFVFKRRIVSVKNLCEEMGLSKETSSFFIKQFVKEGILESPPEFSDFYRISITNEKAIEKYGIVTEERLPERIGNPPSSNFFFYKFNKSNKPDSLSTQ